jgi:hypothetical protein
MSRSVEGRFRLGALLVLVLLAGCGGTATGRISEQLEVVKAPPAEGKSSHFVK